ncbi:hypothetical protein [Rhodopirellula baltica]|uniref:hypothetical protein n=1 Tax=Rhodopirellula baltica TaxID=265606 RepID=UPI0011472984|nr:hypothetical protein [Rhodopirellula baltica]
MVEPCGFTVTSDSTSTFTLPVTPNPPEKTVNGYTFDDYYTNGSIGSHTSNTTIEVSAQHRVDRLNNIALSISGRLAE